MTLRGRWAAGIQPRNFSWILAGSLAVSERPGGYARNHRKVRRQEEIIWLREQGFTRIVSLLASPHNLYAYDEEKIAWSQVPMPLTGEAGPELADLFACLSSWLDSGERVLVHQEELGDRLMGVMATYLLWTGRLEDSPQAITVVERILKRRMGPTGRELLAMMPARPGKS